MKHNAKNIVMAAVVMLTAMAASAQTATGNGFAVKVTADIGLGSALSVENALQGMDSKSSSSGFGFDFGWTFWQSHRQSLEANIGLGFASTSLKSDLPKLDYNYSAPAAADEDMVPYIRYYELDNLHQQVSVSRVTIPIYLNYRYQINRIVGVHALFGLKLGLSASAKASQTSGKVFSYGIYPEYDNLMIDASYMNEFGATTLTNDQAIKPKASATSSVMAGIGAEVALWGPLAADISLRYESGFGNMFQTVASKGSSFTADNAPVTYTVADGQQMTALSNYLTSSKISRLSLALTLIYRF